MSDPDPQHERRLRLREREVAARERELDIRERELERQSRLPALHEGENLVLPPGVESSRTRSDSSLLVFALKQGRNVLYGLAGIILSALAGAVFAAEPSGLLIGLGVASAFALGGLGFILHLALWNEGAA